MVCNRIVEDVYFKYIQFGTLHYRFFTNDELFKCNFSNSVKLVLTVMST